MNPEVIHNEFKKELEARIKGGSVTAEEAAGAMRLLRDTFSVTTLLIFVDNAVEESVKDIQNSEGV